jgi:hypothetical protein
MKGFQDSRVLGFKQNINLTPWALEPSTPLGGYYVP